jgi:hypothetical protein
MIMSFWNPFLKAPDFIFLGVRKVIGQKAIELKHLDWQTLCQFFNIHMMALPSNAPSLRTSGSGMEEEEEDGEEDEEDEEAVVEDVEMRQEKYIKIAEATQKVKEEDSSNPSKTKRAKYSSVPSTSTGSTLPQDNKLPEGFNLSSICGDKAATNGAVAQLLALHSWFPALCQIIFW